MKVLSFSVVFFIFGMFFFTSAYSACNKQEMLSYMKQGLSKEQIDTLCSVDDPEDQKCCCAEFFEKRGGSMLEENNSWQVVQENYSWSPSNMCGRTKQLDFYNKERTFCTNARYCTGKK